MNSSKLSPVGLQMMKDGAKIIPNPFYVGPKKPGDFMTNRDSEPPLAEAPPLSEVRNMLLPKRQTAEP